MANLLPQEVKFAGILEKLLDDKHGGYTRKSLAEALGISSGMVSQYTTRKGQPTLDNLARISELLEVSLDYLVFGIARTEGWAQDSRTAIQYLDVAVSELRSQGLRETSFVGRIATALSRVVHEQAQLVAQQVQHAAQGTALDDEVLIIEQFSTETRVISTDLQYDILESDADDGIPGRFLPVVAENLRRRCEYQFLLPSRDDRDWSTVVSKYRAILRREVGPDLLTLCKFRRTNEPVMTGYGEYLLDIRRFENDEPVLFEHIRPWISSENRLAYVIGPSSEFSGDTLMDEYHLKHASRIFGEMWQKAKTIN